MINLRIVLSLRRLKDLVEWWFDVPYRELTTNESNKLERCAKLLHNVGNLYRKEIGKFYPHSQTS